MNIVFQSEKLEYLATNFQHLNHSCCTKMIFLANSRREGVNGTTEEKRFFVIPSLSFHIGSEVWSMGAYTVVTWMKTVPSKMKHEPVMNRVRNVCAFGNGRERLFTGRGVLSITVGSSKFWDCQNWVTFHFVFYIYWEMDVHVHLKNSQNHF